METTTAKRNSGQASTSNLVAVATLVFGVFIGWICNDWIRGDDVTIGCSNLILEITSNPNAWQQYKSEHPEEAADAAEICGDAGVPLP